MKRKQMAVCACAVGAVLLATSAFADTVIGSGYLSFKNSVKKTASELTENCDSFTMTMNSTVSVDNNDVYKNDVVCKYDLKNKALREEDTSFDNGENSNSIYYSDSETSIRYNSQDDSYYVYSGNNYNNDDESIVENPFNEESAADVEKIADAFVGSLKDVVQTEEAGNKKMYSANLTDSQIPPLVNAVSSYILKYVILNGNEQDTVPVPKQDIYVLGASAQATENENGILDSIVASGSITGADKNGTKHTYKVDILFSFSDINSTVVEKPDLEGKNVTVSSAKDYDSFDEKYVGTYKHDVVSEENNSFVKCGEMVLEITSADENEITGKYYESYKEGSNKGEGKEYSFTAQKNDEFGCYSYQFEENGVTKNAILSKDGDYNIRFESDVQWYSDGNYACRKDSVIFIRNFD